MILPSLQSAASLQNFRSLVLAQAPDHFWLMGEASGTVTATAVTGGIDGTYRPNSAGAWTGGTMGTDGLLTRDSARAPTFNGTSGFIDLGSSTDLDPGTRNMSCMLLISNTNANGEQWRGIQKRGTGLNTTVPGFRVNGGSNALGGSAVPWNLSATQMNVGDGSYAHMSTTDYALAAGMHSIVTTWTNSTAAWLLYIDGVFRETGNLVGSPAGKSIASTRNATIGCAWDASGTQSQFLSGKCQAAAIWWSVLTAGQIEAMHLAAANGRTSYGDF